MHARTRRSARTLTALLAAGGLAVACAATASADLVVNGVDDSVDSTVEQMPLSLSTGAGTTTIYVVAADGDSDPGCNFDGAGETVTVSLAVDRPDVATVHPTSLVLGACGSAGARTVTVTPVGEGTATVTTTVAAGSNKTGGTFSIANARFTARVSAVPNTPPTLAVVGVEEGGQYPKGTLERPSCVATDPDDVPEAPHTTTTPALLTALAGPWAADGIGTRYAMCSYVDGYGTRVLARTGYSIVDDSAPLVQRTIDPGPSETGWYRGDVTVLHTVVENQSPSSLQPPTGCDPVSVTADTALTTLTCTATSAGGTRTVTTNIRRDATAPAVTSTLAAGGPVVGGWHTSPVAVTFTATDDTSLFLVDGRAARTASHTVTAAGDGEVVVASPAFTDRAGNTAPAGTLTQTVKVDTTAPTVPLLVGGPNGRHVFGEVPAAPTCTSSDTGSGLASCVVTGGGSTVGTHTWTATATDHVGRTSTAAVSYEVLPWTTKGFAQPVDGGGVVNTVKGGSTVPVKFELFAGGRELTSVQDATLGATRSTCQAGAAVDDIEMLASGATSLRYDAVAGHFQYNWKTPTGAACYTLTMTARDGSTAAVATFRTR